MSNKELIRSLSPPDGLEQQQTQQQHDALPRATSDAAHLLAFHREAATHRPAAVGSIRLSSRSSSRQESHDIERLLPKNAACSSSAAAGSEQQQQQSVPAACPVLQAAERAVSKRVLPPLLLLVVVSYSEQPGSCVQSSELCSHVVDQSSKATESSQVHQLYQPLLPSSAAQDADACCCIQSFHTESSAVTHVSKPHSSSDSFPASTLPVRLWMMQALQTN
jgi:hypothetical protein